MFIILRGKGDNMSTEFLHIGRNPHNGHYDVIMASDQLAQIKGPFNTNGIAKEVKKELCGLGSRNLKTIFITIHGQGKPKKRCLTVV